MKTYILTVSITFPKTHKRAGEQTWFVEKINEAGMPISDEPIMGKKIHTIRANYELWEKRIKDVQDGKAVLSIRYWSGKPYNSKQVEIHQLDKDSGVGVQKICYTIDNSENYRPIIYDSCKIIGLQELSKNDGLSLDDFKEWFKKYDLSKPMAIIQFTDFRY